MAKTSLDTTKFFAGNEGHQDQFVKNCYSWYWGNLREQYNVKDCSRWHSGNVRDLYYERHYYDLPQRGLEQLHVFYAHGVENGWLKCSYPEFEDAVLRRGGALEKERPDRYPDRSKSPSSIRRRRLIQRFGKYRVGTKYVRNKDHLPKERYSNKEDWRAKKGFTKDKTRPHWFSGTKTRNFYKNLQNRQRRRKDRSLLAKGDYDAFVGAVFDIPANVWAWY